MTHHVLDHGGDGPTLILAHGLTANAHFFDGMVEANLTRYARVIVPDLRGRGLSDKPDDGYEMADHAADILAIIDVMDLGDVIMGGHSFGGLLTYYIAANHPDSVERCIALDAPIDVDRSIVDQLKPSLARLDMTAASLDEYIANVRTQPYFDDGWDPAIESYYEADVVGLPDGSVTPRPQSRHIAACIEGTLTPEWSELVARIRQPTLIARAREPFGPPGSAPIVDGEQAKHLMNVLPNGRMVELDGNHITAFFGQGAATTVDAISTFLRET